MTNHFFAKKIWPYALLMPSIVILRSILEGFSDVDTYRAPKTIETATEIFSHFLPWYFFIFLCITITLHLITKKPIGSVFKFISLGSLIILLPPIIDLVVSAGRGLDMAYCQPTSWKELGLALLTMCGPNHLTGVTFGIMTELLLILAGCVTYVILATKKLFLAIISSILVYLIIMFVGIAPALLTNLSLSLHFARFPISPISIGAFFFLLLIMSLITFLNRYQSATFKLILKNARLQRGLIYLVFLGLGIALGLTYYGETIDWSLATIIYLILSIIAILGAWGQAALVNDIMDQKIDKISNPQRSLITGRLIPADYWRGAVIMTVISLGAARYVNYTFLILILAYIIVTFFYSCPPLRLRQIVGISNFIIGLAALICFLAGFAIFAPQQSFLDFPLTLIFITVILVTAVSIVKDLKDIEGDAANQIQTIPSLLKRRFPVATVYRLIGILIAASFLVVPLVFYQYSNILMFVFTGLFAFLIYWQIGEIRAKDKYCLMTIYLFIAVVALIILGPGLRLP